MKTADLLTLSSSTLARLATIPRTSLINGKSNAWLKWLAFNQQNIPAAEFSCCNICPIVSSSVREELSLAVSATGAEQWYLPRLTKIYVSREKISQYYITGALTEIKKGKPTVLGSQHRTTFILKLDMHIPPTPHQKEKKRNIPCKSRIDSSNWFIWVFRNLRLSSRCLSFFSKLSKLSWRVCWNEPIRKLLLSVDFGITLLS